MTNVPMTAIGFNAPLPTILGNGALRIPTAGKIRAGIKVLTKTAANNPKAKEIYESGVAANRAFEEIEREIREAVPELKNPLTPKNVAWFTVRPQDFPNPVMAIQIMDAYGEDRGDGVRRLYRFPVIWPADTWQAVMPHQLVAWGANERKYWSEYSPDGGVRYCECHAPVARDATGKRAIRVFGGRKTMLRPDNGGVCEPEACPQYQSRQCNLSGRFIFYIPGIRSIDAIELTTNSFYAMNAAIQKFQAIQFLRGGRLSGFLDGRCTPFYIAKRRVEVPHIDEDGKAVRASHWIIELEAPVDISALLATDADQQAVLVRANEAVHVLGGQAAIADDRQTRAVDAKSETPTFENRRPPNAAPQPASPAARSSASSFAAEAPSVKEILATIRSFGIDPDRFEQYAAKRWGSGWKANPGGRQRVQQEVARFEGDRAALIQRIEAALDPFAKVE